MSIFSRNSASTPDDQQPVNQAASVEEDFNDLEYDEDGEEESLFDPTTMHNDFLLEYQGTGVQVKFDFVQGKSINALIEEHRDSILIPHDIRVDQLAVFTRSVILTPEQRDQLPEPGTIYSVCVNTFPKGF